MIFHFALRAGGRLFLGASEGVDDNSSLFTPVDKKHRIYAPRASVRPSWPLPVGPKCVTVLPIADRIGFARSNASRPVDTSATNRERIEALLAAATRAWDGRSRA